MIERHSPDDEMIFEDKLKKFLQQIVKNGAAKTADIMIPSDQKFTRLRKFIEIQWSLSKEAQDNLNYNLTMFCKE